MIVRVARKLLRQTPEVMRLPASDADADTWRELRHQMVDEQMAARGIRDARVLAAMGRVPRHLFVPMEHRALAYADRPLPIGWGQTISQPFMVALILEAASLRGNEHVLDVGTGSGYQAALLGELARDVVSVEIVAELARSAAGVLQDLGMSNVTVVATDGSVGYEPAAPYDVIVVAAAAPSVPKELVEQLRVGGRLLIPVGPRRGTQILSRIVRTPEGSTTEALDACAFVPLVGRRGVPERGPFGTTW
jgi:protein-L-isoaspartate(D-aspartate) O-methyltransferase